MTFTIVALTNFAFGFHSVDFRRDCTMMKTDRNDLERFIGKWYHSGEYRSTVSVDDFVMNFTIVQSRVTLWVGLTITELGESVFHRDMISPRSNHPTVYFDR